MGFYMIFLITALTVVLVQNAYALNCYNCTSKHPNHSCFDPLNPAKIKPISCDRNNTNLTRMFAKNLDRQLLLQEKKAKEYQCVFYKTTTHSDNATVVVRACAPVVTTEFCKFLETKAQMEDLIIGECKTCNIDNCNARIARESGSSLHISVLSFLFAFFMLASNFV